MINWLLVEIKVLVLESFCENSAGVLVWNSIFERVKRH